ncbi:MAG TPA: pyruvate, phosphate dikinase [Gaiellales bacterium]|nr:pyruvate, phosphate dikinase [Gaiellales bacterium]
MTRYVYDFSEGSAEMRSLLGGKGANLAEMTSIGLPVPHGFTVTTEACLAYLANDGRHPEGLDEQVAEHLGALEERAGRRLGAPDNPLLVSVRSGAVQSMPGMMDTILNLGMNDRSVRALADVSGDERFAYDSYRRFVQMFGDVVAGVDANLFENALGRLKMARGAAADVDLSAEDLRDLVGQYLEIYRHETGEDFPQDPAVQLERAIDAVFESWNTPRAITYRREYRIPDDLGTAVNVVQMVFGNMGEDSATGVCFTRNPSTGARERYGEFLINAQGEDVVAGIRTPQPLTEMESVMPEAYAALGEQMERLEQHYADMQDIEFTVERGSLYILQTRSGKRTAAAAVKIARDMVEEGVIDRDTALLRVDPASLDQLLHPAIDPTAERRVLTRGLNASPGAAVGAVVFDADTAEQRGRAGQAVVLVRWETTPDDIHGVLQAQGVLTARGGMTSHAAVVARQMGKPCVAGAEALDIDLHGRTVSVDGVVVAEGDEITIDGGTGEVILGAMPLVPARLDDDFRTITGWADEVRRLRVRANADTPEDAAKARELGAEGIGLCRTEHMFFGEDRLPVVQAMIMASDEEGRRTQLDRLLPFQESDFRGIFEAMAGLPVTIRLLDPPLHEFLPDLEDLNDEIARGREEGRPGGELAELERVAARVRTLHEQNPMLGMRGCRLGLMYPEIYEMQVRAIVRAARAVDASRVEIMHPLVGFAEELRRLRALTERVIAEEGGEALGIHIGTMIEVPRAALTAGEIAEVADFFSFGTNDLTQMTLAFSRDDAEGGFLTQYLDDGVIARNPFETLDRSGVGSLIELAARQSRGVRDGIKLGICGEHGGDPDSVAFCDRTGLDYVSCSPFRVPIARLAAAQAALRREEPAA